MLQVNAENSTTETTVLSLAERNWHLVPIKSGDKKPILSDWGNQASCDPVQVERWSAQYPACNWGLLLGPQSGIIDLEDDTPEGRELFEAAMEACGVVTPCYTSGKSVHRLFQYDERFVELTAITYQLFGCEFRFGVGGKAAQSVIPPSVHPSGAVYAWLPGRSPDDVEVARLPDAMWNLFLDLRLMDDQRKAEEREAKQTERKVQTVVPCSVTVDGVYTSHVEAAEAVISQIPFDSLLTTEGWTNHNADEWTRPGSDWSNAKSATLNVYNGQERLTVWTNAAPIEGGTEDGRSCYSAWRFWYTSNGFLDSDQINAAKAFLGDQKSKEINSAFHNQGHEPGDISWYTMVEEEEAKLQAQAKQAEAKPDSKQWQLKSVWSAVAKPAPKREVIIEGLMRRGEVANIIASTKTGKSWLAVLLGMKVATGDPWLGRQTTKGRVLLIDNELHDEEIQNRMANVANAAGIITENAEPFEYVDLRGQWVGIQEIEFQLSRFEPGELTLVVLDAKYRFFSNGMQENSNDDQTAFHNEIDKLARRLNCAIVMVHHATKGDQGQRAVTDVGSGGGSQARAADCHIVIRSHADGDDLAVLDAAVRSFPPVKSQTLRWSFPLWTADTSVEATVKQAQTRNDANVEKSQKTKIGTILDMLRRSPDGVETENRLSGGHPSRTAFRAALTELEGSGEIEFVKDYIPPRRKEVSPAWRVTG